LAPDVELAARAWLEAPQIGGIPLIFNLPAFLIVAAITVVLVKGIRESAWVTTGTTVTNVIIILFFCIVGAFYVEPANWKPFAPHGAPGIFGAAALIFFAYIGFDAISTTAEETRNPQRDMPIGMIASLVICTVIYMAVAVILTGLVRWDRLGTAQPLATAYSALGMTWASVIISVGAMLACTSVIMVMQLGQARIFFSMARDGLLPPWAAKVHPRYRTPHVTTILIGVAVAGFASCTNIAEVVELSNIGTLFAFLLVSAGILVLRHLDPDRPRPFRTPFVPLLPLVSVASCALLMSQLPGRTWWRFAIWLTVGLVLYFAYGYRHSRMRDEVSAAVSGER
jgi:APA family basic amino acid/polyamine antiporter